MIEALGTARLNIIFLVKTIYPCYSRLTLRKAARSNLANPTIRLADAPWLLLRQSFASVLWKSYLHQPSSLPGISVRGRLMKSTRDELLFSF
jgi:hypothetical protein